MPDALVAALAHRVGKGRIANVFRRWPGHGEGRRLRTASTPDAERHSAMGTIEHQPLAPVIRSFRSLVVGCSHRFAECVRCSLQTLTDFGQFSRREVDALLLGIRTRLLAVSATPKRLELFRHLRDSTSQISQLTCDERCILFARHLVPCRILWPARVDLDALVELRCCSPMRRSVPRVAERRPLIPNPGWIRALRLRP
jgi:hypothetical protein